MIVAAAAGQARVAMCDNRFFRIEVDIRHSKIGYLGGYRGFEEKDLSKNSIIRAVRWVMWFEIKIVHICLGEIFHSQGKFFRWQSIMGICETFMRFLWVIFRYDWYKFICDKWKAWGWCKLVFRSTITDILTWLLKLVIGFRAIYSKALWNSQQVNTRYNNQHLLGAVISFINFT